MVLNQDYHEYLHRYWLEHHQLKLKPRQWLKAFPEMTPRVMELQLEAEIELDKLKKQVTDRLKDYTDDSTKSLVIRELVNIEYGPQLDKLTKMISWWRRCLFNPNKLTPTGITENMVDDARETSIVGLINQQPRRSGQNNFYRCPFHEEKTASFCVFPDNHFHCFGCGISGDSIAFVMKRENLTFPQAVKFLVRQ